MMLIGIVGKPSCGKSTFLNALTMVNAKVGDYPFTTIEPNRGTAYVRSPCVCKELGVTDDPKNSLCEDGIRFLPIQFLDVAGLVPGASEGRGLGNKFLDDLRQADVLIHVVDASGSLDAEGNVVDKGSWDPLDDVKFLEEEINAWILAIINRDYETMKKKASAEKLMFSNLLYDKLTGLAIKKHHIEESIREVGMVDNDASTWDEKLPELVTNIRNKSKPIIIVANKIDQPDSHKNYLNMKEKIPSGVFPISALAEVFLRNEQENKTISYSLGDSDFEIIDREKLGDKKESLIQKIKTDLLVKYGSTGVQEVLSHVVFTLLDMIVVYPVEDITKFTDKSENVLPDAFLVPKGTTTIELAAKIHTDFAKNFIHGQLAPSGRRIGADYEVQNNDVIRIVAAVK
ncbi:MAG: redox-regulated ATPase YchF [Candidatus Heimdallarchaeota archaeon]|nr:redox-regulated ATPase YchF [Candidatus Heimdallarchaeota archaeon]MCK4878808.1 redox-regulated ATPase YchF [Candidatus Heimdallarchaeota archaeon]